MLLVLIECLVLQKAAKGKKAAPAENGDAKTEVCTSTWTHVYKPMGVVEDFR